LSWLERALDKREVGSSNLPRPTTFQGSDIGIGVHAPECWLLIPDIWGAIAQLGERLLCKQEVVGSFPSGSTSLSFVRSERYAQPQQAVSLAVERAIFDIVKRKDRSETRS